MLFPACRHAEGTISSSSVLDVWRMASEDSDELVSGLAMVHRLCNLGDLDETLTGQMPFGSDDVHTPRELLEIMPLRGAKRILTEERNDHLHEIRATSDE